MVLKDVTRLNSGEYECTLVDMESFEELSGKTTVFVHCKDFTLISFVTNSNKNKSLPRFSVCIDLDPPVIKPSETIVVDNGKEVKVTCNALSSLSTKTTWFKVTLIISFVQIYKQHLPIISHRQAD